MYIQFLVEDPSGGKLIDMIMKKYCAEVEGVEIHYDIRPYKGIGGIPKGTDAHNNKSQQLLNDLPKRLKAFNVILRDIPDAALFVVLDNDTRNPKEFQDQLKALSHKAGIKIDHAFCIAIEEMEAWLLGDRTAIQLAYPKLADRIVSKHAAYKQDSICGTWEMLADLLTKKGFGAFQKQNPTSYDVGKCKIEWAENIGNHLNLRENTSMSFVEFISQLDFRRNAVLERN